MNRISLRSRKKGNFALKMVDTLLERGGDPTVVNKDGNTPLDLAKSNSAVCGPQIVASVWCMVVFIDFTIQVYALVSELVYRSKLEWLQFMSIHAWSDPKARTWVIRIKLTMLYS